MIPLRFCWDVANIRRWDVSWVLINQILILIIPYGDSCRKWAFRCPPLGWAVESSWVLTSSDKFWHSTPFTGALGAWEQGLESRLVTADGRSAIRTRSLGLYIYYTVYTVYTICKVILRSTPTICPASGRVWRDHYHHHHHQQQHHLYDHRLFLTESFKIGSTCNAQFQLFWLH